MQADSDEKLGTQRFDAVCAFSLLHLVDDIPGVQRNIFLQFKSGAYLFSTSPTDLDDMFQLIIELLAMAVIAWTAWTWRDQSSVTASPRNAVS